MRACCRAWIPPGLIALGLALSGCGGAPEPSVGGHHGRFQVGRPNYRIEPYQVNGVW
jgi:hypothetical protein